MVCMRLLQKAGAEEVISTVLGGFWWWVLPSGMLFSLPLARGLWLPNILASVIYLSLPTSFQHQD